MLIKNQAIRQKKEKIREEMRWKRRNHHNSICPEDEGNKILHRLKQTTLIKPMDSIGGYYPMGSEANTLPILRAYALQNHKIGLPKIKGTELAFYEWNPNFPPETGPEKGSYPLGPTVLIVPLLAFDDQGHRLGQGGGFYDRTLAQLKKMAPSFMAIGIAYDCQKIDTVVCEPHDQKLQAVITPQFTYVFDRNDE